TGGIERDVGRRPVRVDGLVRPCSEEGEPWLRDGGGSGQKARRLLAGFRCQNRRRESAEHVYIRRTQSGRDRGTGAWIKRESFWHQSVCRSPQRARRLPSDSWRAHAIF